MSTERERLQASRAFYAALITSNAGIKPGGELEAAFAAVPRENFIGPPPWKVFTRGGYIDVPSDTAFLYQDVVISLGVGSLLNNGQPTLHAYSLAALAPIKGETVVHVGAGSGYYTAILATLVGPSGKVEAYELHPELARRASQNLEGFTQIRVHSVSGSEEKLPLCDALYVNAGATSPLPVWLDALKPNGRLLFPLTPEMGLGGMLLITRREGESYEARFLVQAQFVPCIGAQDEAMTRKLAEAFKSSAWGKVKSLQRNDQPDESCWCSGPGWWLSTK